MVTWVPLRPVDPAWPEDKIGGGYDGDHHRDRDTVRRDVGRLNALRADGRTILRFTADDVPHHPERVAGTLHRIFPAGLSIPGGAARREAVGR